MPTSLQRAQKTAHNKFASVADTQRQTIEKHAATFAAKLNFAANLVGRIVEISLRYTRLLEADRKAKRAEKRATEKPTLSELEKCQVCGVPPPPGTPHQHRLENCPTCSGYQCSDCYINDRTEHKCEQRKSDVQLEKKALVSDSRPTVTAFPAIVAASTLIVLAQQNQRADPTMVCAIASDMFAGKSLTRVNLFEWQKKIVKALRLEGSVSGKVQKIAFLANHYCSRIPYAYAPEEKAYEQSDNIRLVCYLLNPKTTKKRETIPGVQYTVQQVDGWLQRRLLDLRLDSKTPHVERPRQFQSTDRTIAAVVAYLRMRLRRGVNDGNEDIEAFCKRIGITIKPFQDCKRELIQYI